MDYSQYKLKNYYDKRKKGKKPVYPQQNVPSGQRKQEYNYDYENTSLSTNIVEVTKNSDFEFEHVVKKMPTSPTFKKKKDRTGFIVTLIIIICFVFVILATEMLGGGIIVDGLKQTLNKNYDTSFYYVAYKVDGGQNDATILSQGVKEKYGAGYVYVQNTNYFVVLATYLDKKSADAVAKKNAETIVLEIKLNKPDYDAMQETDKDIVKKLVEKGKLWVEKLYDLSIAAMESETEEVFDNLSSIRNEVLKLKDEIVSSQISKDIKNSVLNVVNPVYLCLEEIILNNMSRELVQSSRYVLSLLVANLTFCSFNGSN